MMTSLPTSDGEYKKPRANFVPGIRDRLGKLPSVFVLPTVVLIITSLYWGQAIFVPVALSILLTFLLSPVAGVLERIGLGPVSYTI
jgi:predicted PurR-regulated permease PerM